MAYLKSYWFDININILYTCHIPGIYLIYDNVNSYMEYITGIYFTYKVYTWYIPYIIMA